jgi:GNAT superfamily N-acetyltransferase
LLPWQACSRPCSSWIAISKPSTARPTDKTITGSAGSAPSRGGRAVGLANCILHRDGWSLEDVCYLQDLYVDESVRGTGAGRALIEAVYAEADARNAPSVYWMTQTFNATGRRLYDRVGVLTPFIQYVRP